jgi:hypothetical protein
VIVKSEPGTGKPTGFFARTRDLFCTIVEVGGVVEGGRRSVREVNVSCMNRCALKVPNGGFKQEARINVIL